MVPKCQPHNGNAPVYEPAAERFNLCAFSRSVHPGKADQNRLLTIRWTGIDAHRNQGDYFAPGGFGPLAFVSAVTVPRATPAPAMTPILIKIERTCRCLAGAIAAPAGREAALPVTLPAWAAAVPDG